MHKINVYIVPHGMCPLSVLIIKKIVYANKKTCCLLSKDNVGQTDKHTYRQAGWKTDRFCCSTTWATRVVQTPHRLQSFKWLIRGVLAWDVSVRTNHALSKGLVTDNPCGPKSLLTFYVLTNSGRVIKSEWGWLRKKVDFAK